MHNIEKREFKNKEKLLDAALEEFGRFSYREASLNNIIRNSKISKGSFYFHFKNKEDLYLYIFKQAAELKVSFFNEKLTAKGHNFEGKDIFEILQEYTKIGFEFTHAYPQYHKLALKFYAERGNEIYKRVKENFAVNLEDSIAPMVKAAIAKGELRSEFSEEFISTIIIGLLNNFDNIFPFDRENINLEKIMKVFDKYVDFMKKGLSKK